MFRTSLLFAALFFCLAGVCFSQTPGGIENPLSSSKRREPDSVFGSPEEEIKYRAGVRREESTHKDMVERAQESSLLAAEIRATFEQSKFLGPEDLKKLERIEKLARKIRGAAGGDDDDEFLKESPQQIEIAVARLTEWSADLLKRVEKTSRFVTSASVIERSNELIKLTRHIKTFLPK